MNHPAKDINSGTPVSSVKTIAKQSAETTQTPTNPPAHLPQVPISKTGTPQTEEPDKVFEFHEPIVYPPSWKMEMADVESNYALLQGGKDANTTLEKVIKDPSKPLLLIGKHIYTAMREMTDYGYKTKKSETAGHFLATQLNEYTPHWEAWGLFMTGQTATGAEVSMEGSDFPRYVAWLKERYPELMERTVICHVHTHPKMGK